MELGGERCSIANLVVKFLALPVLDRSCPFRCMRTAIVRLSEHSYYASSIAIVIVVLSLISFGILLAFKKDW